MKGARIGGLPTWRAVATRVDLLRSTGTRHAWRRWQRDRALARLATGRRERIARTLWIDAAKEIGASVTELGPSRLEIRQGRAVTRVIGQTISLNTAEAAALADDKPAAYDVLARAGVAVPEHLAFDVRDLRGAKAFLRREPGLCVVKPARGSGGDGVTGGVRTAVDLRRAALAAARFSPRLLVERQAEGDVLRLLVLDGEVLDVVRRLPPRITCDGLSSVEELIFAEYDRRIRGDGDPGLKPFAVDLDCILALERASLSLRSVPPAGTIVQVKTVTNYNSLEDNESIRGAVVDELRAQAASAANAVGLRLAGIDIITPTTASGGVVVDLNATPALHHHAHVADPSTAAHVAVPVLRALLDSPPQ